MARDPKKMQLFEHVTTWIGSVPSLVLHTLFFVGSFIAGILHLADWNTVLLVLTTLVSLEAIYLSIFIQMTVNRHAEELEDVSEDIDEIQEDIDEIQEDVDEIQGDVEELSEEDEAEMNGRAKEQVSLEQLTQDVRRVLEDLETLKKQ
ncbi:MAG: DUF1003 domain-containing protein [Patescibacteria group bacterium]|nr:DUF1003 domain-containing protein [Patescibacteria group bacterium]